MTTAGSANSNSAINHTSGRVIVTRPEPDGRHWVAQLRHSGICAEALPLIAVGPVSAPQQVQALAAAWQALAAYSACMFVSGNAVEGFFAQKPVGVPMPPALRFLAPGPGTAAALMAVGVMAAQIDSPPLDADQFDSEALWRVVGQRDWCGRRVLIVRGLGQGAAAAGAPGRDWITRQWRAAGASVDAVSSYERRAPVLDAHQLQQARCASADGSVWLFSSSEAIANLADASGQPGQAIDWSGARAIATHPRIATTARSAGWGAVVESRPALTDIVQTLRAMGVLQVADR
jgi:uroporphyrinogen-III synthase